MVARETCWNTFRKGVSYSATNELFTATLQDKTEENALNTFRIEAEERALKESLQTAGQPLPKCG